MRADAAGAKTWLLAAVAAWALCVWLLALFGVGGKVERLPADPALVQPLPAAPKVAPERLGPLPQYGEIGARPLFANDRRPHAFFINPQGEDDGKGDFDFVLTSVLRTPDFEMAILQPSDGGDPIRLKVGEAPESATAWKLASLAPRSVVFNGPEGPRTLELRVFDGEGGIPPTVMSMPPANPNSGAPTVGRRPVRGQPAPKDNADGMAMDNAGMPQADPSMAVQDADAAQPASAENDNENVPKTPGSAQGKASNAQIDAIRKRIEERRAKLRYESQQPPTTQ